MSDMNFFRRTARYSLSDHQKNKEILVGLRVEPVEEKLGGYKWITTCNNNEQQQDAKHIAEL